MKTKIFFTVLCIVCIAQSFGQINTERPPIIDMHLHVYSAKSYWGGIDSRFQDTVITSPKNNVEHIKEVLRQIDKYNIVITYASGDSMALNMLNKLYPDKFLPSAEIWPTRELLNDRSFIKDLRRKIENGEVLGIGEIANCYTGLAPNDPVMDTLYKIAEEYNYPIGIHFAPGPPGSQLTDFPNMRLEYGNPLMIQDVLIKFPKLRLNIMHAGLPVFPDETFGIMFMFPNVYADIAVLSWYSEYTKESLKDFLIKADRYGFIDRIMFGSDEMTWPGAIGIAIDYINNADYLTDKQKRDILYNNAAKFLRLSDDEINKHHQNRN